jgi:hypothetical protein
MPETTVNPPQYKPSGIQEGQPMAHLSPVVPSPQAALPSPSQAVPTRSARRKAAMALTILDDTITSDQSAHTARTVPERSTRGRCPGSPAAAWTVTAPSPPWCWQMCPAAAT